MPVIWPPMLPAAPLVEGFQETAPTITLRSAIDAGPPKVRRRFTAGISQISCRYTVTRDLMNILDNFYFNGVAGGAIPFEWEHPRRREIVMVRFREAPQYTAYSGDIWTAVVALEVLPPGMAVRLALTRQPGGSPELPPPGPPPPALPWPPPEPLVEYAPPSSP